MGQLQDFSVVIRGGAEGFLPRNRGSGLAVIKNISNERKVDYHSKLRREAELQDIIGVIGLGGCRQCFDAVGWASERAPSL